MQRQTFIQQDICPFPPFVLHQHLHLLHKIPSPYSPLSLATQQTGHVTWHQANRALESIMSFLHTPCPIHYNMQMTRQGVASLETMLPPSRKLIAPKALVKSFFSAVNRAWMLTVYSKTETENLLVSGRSRHSSETYMLSWRCPSPLPHSHPGNDAWGVEQSTDENRHCLCRDGVLVWCYTTPLPMQIL